jgi:hypothetical protein
MDTPRTRCAADTVENSRRSATGVNLYRWTEGLATMRVEQLRKENAALGVNILTTRQPVLTAKETAYTTKASQGIVDERIDL